MKIFIFGDSFSENVNDAESWISLLEKNHVVINFSKGGYSNSDILLSLINNISNITEDDLILFGWTDYTRFHINSSVSNRSEAANLYLSYFFNDDIQKLHYKFYIDETNKILKNRNLTAIIFWSFPANLNHKDITADQWTETYCGDWDYQLRPSLIKFSREEINLKDIKKFYPIDPRPNHISNKEIHRRLCSAIERFINGEKESILKI